MRLMRRIFFFMLFSAGLMAQDVTVVGTVDQVLNQPNLDSHLLKTSVKKIALLKIELSDRARQTIDRRLNKALSRGAELSAGAGQSLQLGMSNVPVLDQGGFGSCVTFANTAAIDAVLKKGDYISQLCQLQLGRYLESNAYVPSGWDGSLGGIVLNQMSVFGIISKAKQQASGCGGVTQYSSGVFGSIPGSAMSPEEYHQLSEPMNSNVVAWSSVLDSFQVFSDKTNMDNTLSQVKEVLSAGDRLTFGVLLPAANKGTAGAVGMYHASNDSWVVTPDVLQDMNDLNDLPGHEMVITGFDDNAVAIDAQGRAHQGLLTLRNSWGAGAGDKGNFYMSYDYFKALAIEVQRIRNLAS